MIYIGNHVSSSKGYEAMGKQEVALGGDTFAFFILFRLFVMPVSRPYRRISVILWSCNTIICSI